MFAPGPMSFAALPPALSDQLIVARLPHTRRWHVTHACEVASGLLPLAEAQTEIGMHPALLTPDGWFHPGQNAASVSPVSLIHTWRQVRQWRSVFARHDIGQHGEILHAHCFSAAMAGIRAGLPIVYDVVAPLGSSAPKPGPWLLRSLRVAESFALSRASSVVVHDQSMWSWALEHGTRAEDLFLVPAPPPIPTLIFDETTWLAGICGTLPAVTLYTAFREDIISGGESLCSLLRAFALLAEEIDDIHLLVETDAADALRRHVIKLGIGDRVHAVSSTDRERALSSCDIVIAGTARDSIDALAYGRALLASDVPHNREVSPDGRGCLWYAPGLERDLAHRAAFLARNPDFCAALGATGLAHLHATRGPSAIARRYDAVYRHALKRHRSDGPTDFHHVPVFAAC